MLTEAPESPTSSALRAGAVIADRFRVQRPFAAGSAYAITYLADDLSRGDTVVVKEFFPRGMVARAADGVTARPHSPEASQDLLRALRRFAVEGSVLSEVTHPHIVRARGLFEANGTAYLVMDHHHSQPLSEYLRANGGRLPAPAAGQLVQHLLTALEPLHAESVVHRDLSPRTVHVQGDGSVLLLEFGARRHLPLHATDLASGFAAFEQYGMRDIGPWTDVYAASALLYHLLTGVVPPSALDRAAGEPLQSPTTLVPNLSPTLARLVLRGMSLLPAQRPHVASELRRQLESALSDGAQTATRAPHSPFPTDALASLGEAMAFDSDDRSGALKLAAGGIVLPGEERGGGLFGRLGSAASRFRRSASPAPVSPSVAAGSREERFASEPEEQKQVVETPQPVAALVPIAEHDVPAVEQRLRPLDLMAQLGLENELAETTIPVSRKNDWRYRMVAAASLVIAIGGSLAFLARSSGAADSGIQPPKSRGTSVDRPAATVAPATAAASGHEVVEAGTVAAPASHPDSPAAHPATSAPAPKVRVAEPVEHRTAAPTHAAAPSVLPPGALPNVNVAVAGPATDLKIVTPDMLVDARTGLTRGQDAADQGDYAVARRAFRGALQQLDSLATRYPQSENVRTLRSEVQQADARALRACGAENEIRTRRGTQLKLCQ